MEIKGMGMWIWVIDDTENGDIDAIIQKAKEYKIRWIMPKATQGTIKYARNWKLIDGVPQIVRLARAAHEAGIAVIPWGWVYGRSPYSPYNSLSVAEARIAVEAIKALDADGWIVDAEKDWKRPHLEMWREVDIYMDELESGLIREGLPRLPIYVSTYRYPYLHREFPFETWRDRLNPSKGDGWMPQVYWEQDTRPLAGQYQLKYTKEKYAHLLSTGLDFIPAGAGYSWGGWRATGEQVLHFLETAIEMNLPPSLWSWQHMWTDNWAAVKQAWADVEVPEEPTVPEEPVEPPVEPPIEEPEDEFIKEVRIRAFALNVRKGPDVHNPLANRPALQKNQTVKVYEIVNGWGRVSNEKCEWISLYWTEGV